jgi:hypothetical protein
MLQYIYREKEADLRLSRVPLKRTEALGGQMCDQVGGGKMRATKTAVRTEAAWRRRTAADLSAAFMIIFHVS